MLHSNIHLHDTKLFCKLLMEKLEAHGQPIATLKNFDRSDRFLKLRI
jgi:hypothetical protein